MHNSPSEQTRTISKAIQQLRLIIDLKRQKNISKIGTLLSYMFFAFYFFVLPQLIYYVWPKIIEIYSNIKIYVIFANAANFSFWIIASLFMVLQWINFDWLERLKVTSKKWPWQQNLQKWHQLLTNTGLVMFMNGVLITSIIMYVTLLKPLPYDFSLQNWPNPARIVIQILFFMLVEDCLFYFSHRMLHQPMFYWIHKRHHEYNQTLVSAAQYSHPIQHIFSGVIPLSTGFLTLSLITNVHFITILFCLIYRVFQSFIGHCGYDFFFDPGNLVPFCIGADHHDFHHANSTGNYGSLFMFWDALFGTQKDYVQWLRKDVKQGKKIDMQKQ